MPTTETVRDTPEHAERAGATGLGRVEQRIAAWTERLRATAALPYTVEIAIVVTLLLLLLYGPDPWYVRIPVDGLCIAALIYRPMARHVYFWLAMASMLAAGTLLSWYSADNHKYLMFYWTVALTCGFASREPARTLAVTARVLIGLCFAFAVGWKLWSPDFRDGTFMQYCLLTDSRFAGFAQWMTGVSADTLAANKDALYSLTGWNGRGTTVVLQGLPEVATLGLALTWWTILIEGWVAVAFLAPRRTWLSRWRDVPLILFVASTYAVATVLGFAFVLIAMGLAQCRSRPVWIPMAYGVAVLLLQLYRVPWSQVLETVAGGG